MKFFPFRSFLFSREGANGNGAVPSLKNRFFKRSIDASSGARRTESLGRFLEPNSEIANAVERVRSRARYLAVNDPQIKSGLENWVAECVGTGLRPSPVVDESNRTRILENWDAWENQCDFQGLTNFSGLLSQIVTSTRRDGESLILMHESESGLQLEHLDSARLDLAKTMNTRGGIIVNGIEFNNQSGQRIAYWLKPRLDNVFSLGGAESIRFPARIIIHCFEPQFAGQIRGLSALASAILPASDLQTLHDAQRRAALISSMIAAFISDPTADAINLDADSEGFESWEPGSVLRVGGSDVKFSNHQQNSEIGEFTSIHSRQVASGVGVPSWLLDGDMKAVNYSSARSALLPFRRRIEQFRSAILIPQVLTRIWNRWAGIEFAIDNLNTIPNANWIAPAWTQVDPEKATKSIIAQLEAGLIDRRTAITQLFGTRAEQIIAELDNASIEDNESNGQILRLINNNA